MIITLLDFIIQIVLKIYLQVLFTRSLAVGQQLYSEAESHVDDKKHDPSIDRTTIISVETSKKYLKSEGMCYIFYR
jgi:hypothetical protein